MVDAIVAALRTGLGDATIRGIYFKGSAQRQWNTLLDYVPELSDVDIHLWLHDDGSEEMIAPDLDTSLKIQADFECTYKESIAVPVHMPRPQITLLNKLKQEIEYVPPPPQVVELLYGDPLPQDDDVSPDEIRRIDAENLRTSYEAIIAMPMQVLDRPGRYSWTSLRNLSWRVSPTGPRVLDLLGMHPDQSWTMNRTGVDRALREHGQRKLADKLTDYYLSAWDYFLSNYRDTDAVRRAILSGAEAVAIANAFVAK